MDKERLEALLEEATVDCYGEDEQFTGVMCTLGEQLQFPLKATVGEIEEVVGIDERRSGLDQGIVARVRHGGQDYRVGLAELEFVNADPTSAEWLEACRYWWGLEDSRWHTRVGLEYTRRDSGVLGSAGGTQGIAFQSSIHQGRYSICSGRRTRVFGTSTHVRRTTLLKKSFAS